MVDIHKVNKNYSTIEKYLKILDKFKFKDQEDFEEKVNDYLAVSMSLFTILNASIEIGESLIEERELDFPSTYKEIFQILGNNKVLSKELAKEMARFMKERNMIAHHYDEINYGEIYKLYLKREIFKKYIEETKKKFN